MAVMKIRYMRHTNVWKSRHASRNYLCSARMAGFTKSIKLGVLVTNNVLRHPGVLVKMVTTLDVSSGGRIYLA